LKILRKLSHPGNDGVTWLLNARDF
jgi:hypothetical protein